MFISLVSMLALSCFGLVWAARATRQARPRPALLVSFGGESTGGSLPLDQRLADLGVTGDDPAALAYQQDQLRRASLLGWLSVWCVAISTAAVAVVIVLFSLDRASRAEAIVGAFGSISTFLGSMVHARADKHNREAADFIRSAEHSRRLKLGIAILLRLNDPGDAEALREMAKSLAVGGGGSTHGGSDD